MIRTVAKWLVIPFIVLLLPVVALGMGIIFINATISGMFHRARWLHDLRRKGRAASAAEMMETATSGTLIVDRPEVNFKGTHCWWTNEDVLAMSPVPIPSDDERLELCKQARVMTAHEFDAWCWKRYLSPDTGSATLVTPPHHGEQMASLIRGRQLGLKCVTSWSAIPAMQSLAQHAANGYQDDSDVSATNRLYFRMLFFGNFAARSE